MDGSDNWQEICKVDAEGTQNAAENYPAFHYANTYGETHSLPENYKTGWYMPSLTELCYVYRNRDVLNKAIKALDGVELGICYWSSSQIAGSSIDAWQLDFANGGLYNDNKDDNLYVCCVRAFSN